MPQLKPGLSATLTQTVTDAMTARRVGSGAVAVFATPELALLLEKAAVAALQGHLPPEQTSVGTALRIEHLAPTPPGMAVTATATLTAVEGRKLTFQLEARDEVETIARGTHTRFLVNQKAFAQKAKAKISPA